MSRRLIVGCLMAAAAVVAIAAKNLLSLQRVAWSVESSDPRNEGIAVWAYHPYGVMLNEVVFDVRSVEGARSPADVTRFLLQFAERLKEREYSKVHLARGGDVRFLLLGGYFQTLGQEFGIQNPIYTLRTLPENLYRPDGAPAFGTWTGGLLGVLGKQMEDLTVFYREWLKD